MKTIYVIPTYHCNLNCSHCELHLKDDNFNDNFYNVLNKIESDIITLFGGEPTLYKDRLIKCLESNKITNISTNLINLDDEILSLYKKYNLSIATSWNPNRFSNDLYNHWLKNLKLLGNAGLKCTIMITLTEDLLLYNNFNSLLEYWQDYKAIDGILFEPLIDKNMATDLHERCDKWLCNIYDNWHYSFENIIINRIKRWNCDCSDTWTLNPDGTLVKGCPQYEQQYVVNECFKCKLADICKPCVLQHLCSFPKQLYAKVVNNE